MSSEDEFNSTDEYIDTRSLTLFPPDLFTRNQLLEGGIVLHILGCLIMFVALFFLNNFLVMPSLGAIMKELNISPASSTTFILAAEKSLPMLMISFVTCFVARNFEDLGQISLIGSSAFNIMINMAVCALATKEVITLPLLSLLRDVVFLLIAPVLLFVFLMNLELQWWEALLQLKLFIAYAVVAIISKFICPSRTTRDQSVNQNERMELRDQNNMSNMMADSSDVNYVLAGIPSKILNRLGKLSLISLLVSLNIMYTICYLIVWWTVIISEVFYIKYQLMAAIFIALGTGLSSLVTSILMTRQGHGVSAVNSCLSSSIFDMTFCVGAPGLFFYILNKEDLILPVSCRLIVPIILFVIISIILLVCRGRVFKPFICFTMPFYLIFIVDLALSNYEIYHFCSF